MITKAMLSQAYDKGLVRIINSPDSDGAVCQIGDDWFYFGGITAEENTAESYIRHVPKENIVSEIFDTLEEFRKSEDFFDEYAYLSAFIQEQL